MWKKPMTIAVLTLAVLGCRPRASSTDEDAGARDAATAPIDGGTETLPTFETDFELGYFDEARGALDGSEPGTRSAQLTSDGRWRSTVERAEDGTVTRTLSRDGAVVRTTVWSADGLTVTADYDDDDDGRAEVHVDVTRGPTIADQRVVVTETREAEGVITERRTYERTDETTVHVTIEQPSSSGVLRTRSTYDTTVLQGDPVIQPLDPNGTEQCANDVAPLVVRRAVQQGIQQGMACMESLDPRAHRCLMDLLATNDVAVHCTSDSGLQAQVSIFDTLVGPIDGTIDITIDERGFFGLPSDVSRAGTMFHELMHVCRGVHDPVTRRAGIVDTYSDSIAGCVATCFGDDTQRDRCTCAACRGTDSCDPACLGFRSCDADGRAYCDMRCTGIVNNPVFETREECWANCPNVCKGGGCVVFAPPCSP